MMQKLSNRCGKNTRLAVACLAGLAGSVFFTSNAKAFVLLSSAKATLPVSPSSPTIDFIWDGKAPEISDKDKYKEGVYQDLEDKEFMHQLLQDALNIWSNVPGSYLKMTIEEGTTATMDENDKIFSIVTEKSDNLSTAAFAKPTIPDDDRNNIDDCDINISDTKTSAEDLAFTITHELGHCIGLGHNHTNYGAIMGYSRFSRQLHLGADDISGLIYLYPDPNYGDGTSKEIVCGSIGVTNAKAALAAMFLLLLPLIAVRRRTFARVPARGKPKHPTRADIR